MVHGHRQVEVEMRVHAQDTLDLGVRPFGVDRRHVRAAPFDVVVTTTRGAGENGRYCEGSRYRRAPMRSRCCSVPGRPAGDTKVSGRGVTSKAPLAHVEGGSGRSEASPTAILQDTHSVEGIFCELRLYGVLRSWLRGSAGGIMLVVEGDIPLSLKRYSPVVASSRKGVRMNHPQTIARVFGVLYLITFITSIPALFVFYAPVLDDPRYILGAGGADNSVAFGAFLELILIIANIGTAVVLWPVLKRVNEILALGFVTARIFECVFIA